MMRVSRASASRIGLPWRTGAADADPAKRKMPCVPVPVSDAPRLGPPVPHSRPGVECALSGEFPRRWACMLRLKCATEVPHAAFYADTRSPRIWFFVHRNHSGGHTADFASAPRPCFATVFCITARPILALLCFFGFGAGGPDPAGAGLHHADRLDRHILAHTVRRWVE